MFNRSLITGLILAGTIAVSGTSFAAKSDETLKSTPGNTMTEKMNHEQKSARIKSVLDGLVKNGTITNAQENAVIKAMEEKREKILLEKKKNAPDEQQNKPCKDGMCKHHEKKHGVLNDLVKDGTITHEQAAAIREALKSARDSMKK